MPHDNIPTICVRFGDQIECRGPQRDFTKILRHWRPQLCTLCACQLLSAKQRETIPNPHYRMRIYHTHSRLTNRTCHSARDEQNSSTMPYATKCLVFKALWQLATEGELDSEESSTEPDSSGSRRSKGRRGKRERCIDTTLCDSPALTCGSSDDSRSRQPPDSLVTSEARELPGKDAAPIHKELNPGSDDSTGQGKTQKCIAKLQLHAETHEAEQAFPTEEREAAKERKKKDKEAGIERTVRKRKKIVEDHFDDCGEDLSSIVPDVDSYYNDNGFDSSDESDRDNNDVCALHNLELVMFWGDTPFKHRYNDNIVYYTDWRKFDHWLEETRIKGCYDIAELTGGQYKDAPAQLTVRRVAPDGFGYHDACIDFNLYDELKGSHILLSI